MKPESTSDDSGGRQLPVPGVVSGDFAGILVVAGATKCGTTSLYNYLAHHPSICASTYKETRFFLCPDDELPGRQMVIDGCCYMDLFPDHKGRWCVEATPDYLYSQGAAGRIFSAVPDARLVFLLREPVDRLYSWYRFAGQNGMLDAAVSFDSYLMAMMDQRGIDRQQHWRALDQGRYARFLAEYFDIFPKQNIWVYDYEEFCLEPRRVTLDIAARCQIDSQIYETYRFGVHNQTGHASAPRIRRLGRQIRSGIRGQISRYPRLHKFAKSMTGAARKPAEQARPPEPMEISTATRERLNAYYLQPNQELNEMLGDQCPGWARRERTP